VTTQSKAIRQHFSVLPFVILNKVVKMNGTATEYVLSWVSMLIVLYKLPSKSRFFFTTQRKAVEQYLAKVLFIISCAVWFY